MYEQYFKFDGLPFRLSPDHRFFFLSSVHKRAIAHLKFGLDQGEGFILVTGEVGSGKTTIVEHLLSTLDNRRYVAANIVTTNLDQENMVRMVASAFGLAQEGLNKTTVFRNIERFIADSNRQGRRCLLFVDEAQNLSVAALEELRMLSNLLVNGKPALQSFLLGQPQFRKTLARPELAQLRQRVIASYHLGPLSAQETVEYICHRLQLVGWQNDPEIQKQAFEEVYRISGGIPRQINTLFTRILLFASLEETHQVTAAMVKAVASELADELEQVLDFEETPKRSRRAAKRQESLSEVDVPEIAGEMQDNNEEFQLNQAAFADDDINIPMPHDDSPRQKSRKRIKEARPVMAEEEPDVIDLTIRRKMDEPLSQEDENRLMRRALHMVIDYLGGRHRA